VAGAGRRRRARGNRADALHPPLRADRARRRRDPRAGGSARAPRSPVGIAVACAAAARRVRSRVADPVLGRPHPAVRRRARATRCWPAR
jgi:hypothetical protein